METRATTTDRSGPNGGRLQLIRERCTDPAALDTAVSHALLQRAARGRVPPTIRLHRPARILAFGPRDRVAPGFPDAVAAARAAGYAPVLRLAGGRAAVFHEGTLALSWVVPHKSPREGIRARFEAISEILTEAFRSLGVDARVGEVPGEYCPGEHSVNAGGRVKVAGVGQRVVAGAAHVGGVVVVDGAEAIREVLGPVYEALSIDWDPATVGSLAAESPGITLEDAERGIVGSFGARAELHEVPLDPATRSLARSLLSRHTAD